MTNISSRFVSTTSRINTVLLSVSALLIFLIAVLICIGVMSRYVFAQPIVWIDELISSTIPLITLLIASYLIQTGEHVAIEYLPQQMTGTPKAILRWLYWTSCLLVSLAITWSGISATWFLYVNEIRSPSLLGVPDWIFQSSIPIGGVFMTLSSIAGAFAKPTTHTE